MDEIKVEAVRYWPEPINVKEIRGFLGFTNFYRRFIKNFGKIGVPFINLTKKDIPFK
jgi:hypothetical protein